MNHDHQQHWWEHLRPHFIDLRLDTNGDLLVDGLRFTSDIEAHADTDRTSHAEPRVLALQHHLYRRCYLQPVQGTQADPSPQRQGDIVPPVWRPANDSELVSGPWLVLEQFADGALAARRGALIRRLEAGEYLYDGSPALAMRGSLVWRRRRRFNPVLDSGFYYISSAVEADSVSEDALVRYYLAPEPTYLGDLITLLCDSLDAASLPFRLKYANTPEALWRPDAVVVYVAARHAHSLHHCLAELTPRLEPLLRTVTPLWTAPLAPGLSFAQEPDSGLSFGEDRCLALAQGLFDTALAAVNTEVNDAQPWVKASFERAGIDWDRPHLNLDEDDRFDLRRLRFHLSTTMVDAAQSSQASLDHPARLRRRRFLGPADNARPGILDQTCLNEALAIGHRLCTDALWHEDACTWIDDDAEERGGQMQAFARTMSGHLYDGSFGVAAFLTLLAAASRDSRHRDTAMGALWHALHCSSHSPCTAADSHTISLYEGRLGVISQGAWLSRRLADQALVAGYQEAATSWLQQSPGDCDDADLMHGLAGGVLGLLGLAESFPSLAEDCHDQARKYAQRLIQKAQHAPAGWHWPSPPNPLGLCGLSHGNAGIALAFGALHRVDGQAQWRLALDATLAYEAYWHRSNENNWPYLFAEDAVSFEDDPKHCGMAWCHGAPGIALARLALWQLTGERLYRDQAESAFASVARDLQGEAPLAGTSFTLCHGPAGNADMLIEAARCLQRPDWELLARSIARRAVQAHSGRWESGLGVAGGHAKGLMLGLAGTGYFLLRCALSEPLPSLLLPFGLLPVTPCAGRE